MGAVRSIQLENIEALRHEVGIDDIELRAAIARLRIGDLVNLSFLLGRDLAVRMTLAVRITSIRGTTFRGKLLDPSGPTDLSGHLISFTPEHIHSLTKRLPTHASR